MLDRTKAPVIKPFGELILPDEHQTVLSNGLTLHTLSGGDQDVVRLSLIVEGGPADYTNPCIPAFAAELMREGCVVADSDAIADLVDYNGALFNSQANGHFTSLRLSCLTSRLEALSPTIISCLTAPTFPEKAFKIIRAKGAARQRLNLSRVSFLSMADNHRLIAGPGHPESLILTPEEIEAIDYGTMTEFHSDILNAHHIHAYISGRFHNSDIERLISLLQTIPSSDAPSPVTIIPFAPLEPQTSVTDKPGSLQSAVTLSIPAILRSDPDYNALRMTVTALGGYFGSRLMMNIREDKGYTYGISAALLGTYEGSYVSITAQCDNRYTSALIDEVRHELRRMVDEPLTASELEKLKFNVASDLATTLDSPFTAMDYYELKHTVGVPDDYFRSRQETLARISPEIICEMARKYLNLDSLRISIAGDQNATQ